jgi:hypothetical protein
MYVVKNAEDLIRASAPDVYFVWYDAFSFRESISAGLKAVVNTLGWRIIANKKQF